MENQTTKSTGCCEPFDPEPWNEKEFTKCAKVYGKNYVVLFAQID